MLNLLFISDSPKTEHIKSVLQPELKVIIDIVNDFDHGLKDVFEKRPATVCIQDQIGGVTGESVARHIQMLLGASAPTFILLHSGNGKARMINGLFEHLIDLSQANDTLSGEIKSTLKTLLGDHWEKIYIPPKLAPASVRSSVALPEESREDADRLVDDFISDLETSGFLVADEQPPAVFAPEALQQEGQVPQTDTSRTPENRSAATESIQEFTDDVVDKLLEEARKSRNVSATELSVEAVQHIDVDRQSRPEAEVDSVKPSSPGMEAKPSPVKPSSAKPAPVKPPTPALPKKKHKEVVAPEAEPQVPQPPIVPAAAEFRISQDVAPEDDHIPEDLLLAFEENYRSESPLLRRGVVIALVCVLCAAGGWFLFTQKPQLLMSLKQRITAVFSTKPTPPAPAAPPAVPKPVAADAPPTVTVPSLPSFVPKDGLDSSYGAKNPGWERYVGKNAEFRLFSASGRMQALQVIAVKGAPLSESYIASVLQEFAGASGYQITSSSVKAGVRVENGMVPDKAEVKIYKQNGVVKAFVVSVK